ncbi:sulfatase-like hydrolase/transferase [Altererythrobacter salegens]|uniref:Sulfatase-like hydrolase/transferase n=1 Tax=Croceibacterium salegens TaxID=1737568 RepID=A0A6I4SVB6_9SPHN|nr:sulfatase-like hydrolase/transferase [Croceibacterium salegens]MXO58990.1 sulfatase-like hydrolase/transferase [Croceibacterium salegens]
MKRILLALAAAAALGSCVADAPPEQVAAVRHDRPNILLIIADDIGMDGMTGMYPGLIDELTERYGPSGFNNPEYRRIAGHPASTPVMDAFARQSMTFSQAWAEPFCSPTRASLLTGLNASRHRVQTYADALDQHHDSFVRMLHDAGYRTGVFGKWHMAGLPAAPNSGGKDYPGMKPKEAGFERFEGNMHAALRTYWDYEIHEQDDATAPDEFRTTGERTASLPGIAPTTFAGVVKTADAIDWIRAQEKADPNRPWFAWVAFNLSHATIVQRPSAMMIPNADTLDAKTRAEVEACGGKFGTMETGDCSGETQFRAMTNAMDTLIGHLLSAIDDPDTYVIFVGDNGTPMYGRPMLDFIDNMYITRKDRGKGSAYQGGALVPMAIRGPGVKSGTSSGQITHVVDLFSTILDMAGLPVPQKVADETGARTMALDGRSLFPILTGKASANRDPWSDFVVTESTNLMVDSIKVVGIRNAKYKLTCTKEAAACEFYDIAGDPLEQYPLRKPASCTAYTALPKSDPAWNYCRMMDEVRGGSILGQDA